MIKAVLFDMDGVLIEAKDWHYEALNKALHPFGMPISRQDHLDRFDGLPTRKKLEILTLERGLSPEHHTTIAEMKQQYTLDIAHERCKPSPLHERALTALKKEGYKLAVCSNSVRSTVELLMKQSKLAPYLDLMLSNEDVSCGKPDPEMYLKAMAHFELPPQECLIVEDNENGIKAARASGGHLLVVKTVEETNLDNIRTHIREIESETNPYLMKANSHPY